MESSAFHCKTCDRPFRANSKMLEHQRICRKRNYCCEFCGQPFLRPAYLREHIHRGCVHEPQCAPCAPEELIILSSDSEAGDNDNDDEVSRLRAENSMLYLQNQVLMEQNELLNQQMQQYFYRWYPAQ